MPKYFRVHLSKNFVVAVDDWADRKVVRHEALLELRLLAQDGWFLPADIEIIEQVDPTDDEDDPQA